MATKLVPNVHEKKRLPECMQAFTTEPGPDGKRRYIVRVRCTECDKTTLDFPDKRGANHAYHIQQAQRKGWVIYGNEKFAQCPSCKAGKRKQAGKEEKPMSEAAPETTTADRVEALHAVVSVLPMPETAEAPAPVVTPTAVTSEPAKKASRFERIGLATMYLQENYIPAIQGYKAGASDAGCAEISGLTLEQVAELREEDFGPLLPLAELQAGIEVLRGRIEVMAEESARRLKALEDEMVGAWEELPEPMKAFLSQKREATNGLLTGWKQRAERVENQFNKESQDFFAALEKEFQDKWKTFLASEAGGMQQLLAQVRGEGAALDGLRADLEALAARMPQLPSQ